MMKKNFDKDWDLEQNHDIIKDITKPLQPQQPKQFHYMKINKNHHIDNKKSTIKLENIFRNRIDKISLKSTFIHARDNLSRTTTLSQQDFQTLQFTNEEIITTLAVKHKKYLTNTPHNYNTINKTPQKIPLQQPKLHSLAKSIHFNEYSTINYQTYKPIIKKTYH